MKRQKQEAKKPVPVIVDEKTADVRFPRPFYEKLILIVCEIFSLWLLVSTLSECTGLWIREEGAVRTESVLLGVAFLLYLLALIFLFFDALRLPAVLLSFGGAVISIWTGFALSSTTKLGYINDLNQTFTETIPFWWGHILPAAIFIFALVLFLLLRLRKKQEERYYLEQLKKKNRSHLTND